LPEAPAPLPDPSALIPHREGWLLISRLLSLDETEITAEASFTPEQVRGHFPGQPVVPGVLLLESLAQTMACLHTHLRQEDDVTPMLAGFEKVRFKAPVLPPATVRLSVKLKEERFGLVTARGVVTWEGRRVCIATLTGALIPTP